jgi:hypothetical protein
MKNTSSSPPPPPPPFHIEYLFQDVINLYLSETNNLQYFKSVYVGEM